MTDLVTVVQNWRNAKSALDGWKPIEANARADVVSFCFPKPIKGTQRYDLGGGYKLKLVHGTTYTLGHKDMVDPATNEKVPVDKQVEAVLEEIAALGNEGGLLADRLVKWKPELVESEYLKLNPEFPVDKKAKELIETILTIKPAAPQLTFEEPKAPASA